MFSADPGNLDLGDLELTWLPASEHSPRLFTQSQDQSYEVWLVNGNNAPKIS